MSRDLSAIAAALARRAELETLRHEPKPGEPLSTVEIGALIAARRARADAFGLDLVHPGWSLLLRLYLAHLEGDAIRVSRLTGEASLATATALRWLKRIYAAGLATKKPVKNRPRAVLVELTPAGAAAMREHLQMGKAGGLIA
ncbi:MAG TPA: MarR family winged helix-turn-helix transcriptional regulator [Allosphingosinicella sp.]